MFNRAAIVDRPCITISGDKLDIHDPVPHAVCPLNVGLVFSVASQTRGEVEKTTVSNGVFVVVTIVPGENLPAKTSTTVLRVPACSHGIKHGLGQVGPRRFVIARRFEIFFCSGHDGNTPKSLIIVTLGSSLVGWHVVPVLADLKEKRRFDNIVVFGVVGVVPVINHGTPSGASLPPIVGVGKHAGCLSGIVTIVVVHETLGKQRKTTANGSCVSEVNVESEYGAGQSQREEKRRELHES